MDGQEHEPAADDELLIDPDAPDPLLDDLEQAGPPPRTRRGASGIVAAAMLGLRDALEGPKKETIVVQVDAAGDPPNIDVDGLDEALGEDHRMSAPPLDSLPAPSRPAARSRRRRRPR